MITIALINNLAVLNNFVAEDAIQYVPGSTVKVNFQISDDQTNQRLIPGTAAECTATIQNSDGTFTDIDCTMLFNPDDRSCWSFTMTTDMTMLLVGGNFKVTLDFLGDGTDIRVGMAYNVLSKITFDGSC